MPPSPINNLSIRKAAILLTTLNREQSAKVLRNMAPDTVRAVTNAVRNLGVVSQEEQNEVFTEFSNLLRQRANVKGGEDVARALLQDVVGEQEVKEIMNTEKRDLFSAIMEVPSQNLAGILSNEQTSVIGMILAFMPSKKAAEIITYLEPDLREILIGSLAKARVADPEIVARIEKIFVDKVVSVIHTTKSGQSDSIGGPQFVADMMQHIDRTLEEELMRSIEDYSQESADEIRDLMFTFEDVVKLSNDDIQKILRQVPIDKLVIALRGVPEVVVEKFTGNLSKRAQETLEEEADLLGKVKLKDVEAEQRNIVATVRALEAAGELNLRSEGGEDVYV